MFPELFARWTDGPSRWILRIAACSSADIFSIRAFSCSVTVSAFTIPAATNFSRFDMLSPSVRPRLGNVRYRTRMIAPDFAVSTKNGELFLQKFYFGHGLAIQHREAQIRVPLVGHQPLSQKYIK